jgi:hypothetical protein
MTTQDQGPARTDDAGGARPHLAPNAFARELLAHDPSLPEMPDLPADLRDDVERMSHDHAAEGPNHGDDEGERFDAG